MAQSRSPLLIISGPTASGKSKLALRLALDLQGEIVNIDSVQIYRGLDVGSAKPSPQERNLVKHHMLDVCDPRQEFNVSEFKQACSVAIAQICAHDKQPVLVGGSTLYLTCLLHGLADLPRADAGLRAELESLSSDELKQRLQELDALAAQRIHVNDRLRLIRALETCLLSETTLSALHQEHGYSEKNYQALIVVLCWPRSELYRRIEQRTEQMLQAGLVEEVRALIDLYGPELRSLKSLGYAQTIKLLKGETQLAELAPEIQQATRRFAKRQMTFFRNEPGKRAWICRPEEGSKEGKLLEDPEMDARLVKQVKDFRVLSMNYDELFVRLQKRLRLGFESNELWYLDATALDLR